MARYFPDNWPIPEIDKFNREFFTSGKLVVQECGSCGTVQHPPEEVCHKCYGMEFKARETNGRGTIHSYIVVHNPPSPAFVDAVPYGVVLVSLDEFPQLRILGNVLNRKPSELAIGQKTKAVFEEIDDDEAGGKLLMPQWEVV